MTEDFWAWMDSNACKVNNWPVWKTGTFRVQQERTMTEKQKLTRTELNALINI